MDIKGITKSVREYFEEQCGTRGMFEFKVLWVELHPKQPICLVECEHRCMWDLSQRSQRHRVLVDAETGEVRGVKALDG